VGSDLGKFRSGIEFHTLKLRKISFKIRCKSIFWQKI